MGTPFSLSMTAEPPIDVEGVLIVGWRRGLPDRLQGVERGWLDLHVCHPAQAAQGLLLGLSL